MEQALITLPQVAGLVLHAIVKEGSVQDLNDFFLKGRKDISVSACQALDSYGMAPIHYAALFGRLDMVRALMAQSKACNGANGLSVEAYVVIGVIYHEAMRTGRPLAEVCNNSVLCDRLHALSPLLDRWAAEADYAAVIEILSAVPLARKKLPSPTLLRALTSFIPLAVLAERTSRSSRWARSALISKMISAGFSMGLMYAPQELPLMRLLRTGGFDEARALIESGAFCLHEVDIMGHSPMSYALSLRGPHEIGAHVFFKENFSRYLACGGPLGGPKIGFLEVALQSGAYDMAYFLLEKKVTVKISDLVCALRQKSPESITFVKHCLDSSLISAESLAQSNGILLFMALKANAYGLALQLCDCGAPVKVAHLVAVMEQSSVPLDERITLFQSLFSRAEVMTSELVREALGIFDGEVFMEHVLFYHQASYERFKAAYPAKGERVGLKTAPSAMCRHAIADFVGVSPEMGVAGTSTDLLDESEDIGDTDDLLSLWLAKLSPHEICLKLQSPCNASGFLAPYNASGFLAKIRCLVRYYAAHHIDSLKGLLFLWHTVLEWHGARKIYYSAGSLRPEETMHVAVLDLLSEALALGNSAKLDCAAWINELLPDEAKQPAIFQDHSMASRFLCQLISAFTSIDVTSMSLYNFQQMVSLSKQWVDRSKDPKPVATLFHEIGERLRLAQTTRIDACIVEERLEILKQYGFNQTAS